MDDEKFGGNGEKNWEASAEAVDYQALAKELVDAYGLTTALIPPLPPRKRGHSFYFSRKIENLIRSDSRWEKRDRTVIAQLAGKLHFSNLSIQDFDEKDGSIILERRIYDSPDRQLLRIKPDISTNLFEVKYLLSQVRGMLNYELDESAFQDLLCQLFDMPDLKATVTHSRPSGMSFAGTGQPAVFRSLKLSTKLRTRPEAIRFIQATELMPYLLEAINSQIQARIREMTAYSKEAGAGTYRLGEVTLGEVVEDTVYKNVTEFLESHPDMLSTYIGYNSFLTQNSIQTFVSYRELTRVLGGISREKFTKLIDRFQLSTPINGCVIKELTLKKGNRTFTVPLPKPIEFGFWFYQWPDGEGTWNEDLQRDLARRIGNWRSSFEAKQRQGRRTESSKDQKDQLVEVRDLATALKVFGLTKLDFENLSHRELRSRYANLVNEFHPDKHQDDQTRQIAERMMMMVNGAYKILAENLPRRD